LCDQTEFVENYFSEFNGRYREGMALEVTHEMTSAVQFPLRSSVRRASNPATATAVSIRADRKIKGEEYSAIDKMSLFKRKRQCLQERTDRLTRKIFALGDD
jgi:hypothetical protein